MSVACLIFSRDRACQLDMLLRSIERCAPALYSSITVLYRSTSAEHELAYLDALRGARPCVRPWRQGPSFEEDVREWLAGVETPLCSFLVDDDVFYRPLSPFPLVSSVEPEVFGVSLRLGENTTFCHPMQREQAFPRIAFAIGFPSRQFLWRESDGDFGYPFALDGTIMHTEVVRNLLSAVEFRCPTTLEASVASLVNERKHSLPPWLRIPKQSVLVGLPLNVVSEMSGNPRGADPDFQPDALCRAFLDGYRLVWADDPERVNGAHFDARLALVKGGDARPPTTRHSE